MTETRSRSVPVLIGVVGVALLGALVLRQGAGDGEPLPTETSVRCRDKVAEVEYGADLGKKARPVKLRYWRVGRPPTSYTLTTDWWTTVEQVVPCPATVRLTVNPGDVWGGDTECWISVDGVRRAEQHTRQRAQCSVTVRLEA